MAKKVVEKGADPVEAAKDAVKAVMEAPGSPAMEKAKAAGKTEVEAVKEAEEKDLGGSKGLALITRVAISDRNLLSDVADKIRDKQKNIAMVLIGESDSGKPKPMIVAVSKSLKSLHAGKITRVNSNSCAAETAQVL